MVDVQFSSPQSISNTTYFRKRRHEEDMYNDEENLHPQFQSLDRGHSFERGPEKRARRSALNSTLDESDIDAPIYSKRDLNKIQQEYESKLGNIKMEANRTIQEKDTIIQDIRNNLKNITDNLQSQQSQLCKYEEENNLFKRAIGIQEGRYRELSQQNAQQRETLQQAIDYITNLEYINQKLKENLRNNNGPEFISYQPPPDVY